MGTISVCFVCLGNICRSPTAEGVFTHLVRQGGHEASFRIDSAGTAAYHAGESPDRRATAAARTRGIALTGRARQFQREDFERFDHILAMDRANLDALRRMAPDDAARGKIRLLRDHEPDAPSGAEVPDPYYGGPDGFDRVLDMCTAACKGLLDELVGDRGER